MSVCLECAANDDDGENTYPLRLQSAEEDNLGIVVSLRGREWVSPSLSVDAPQRRRRIAAAVRF